MCNVTQTMLPRSDSFGRSAMHKKLRQSIEACPVEIIEWGWTNCRELENVRNALRCMHRHRHDMHRPVGTSPTLRCVGVVTPFPPTSETPLSIPSVHGCLSGGAGNGTNGMRVCAWGCMCGRRPRRTRRQSVSSHENFAAIGASNTA